MMGILGTDLVTKAIAVAAAAHVDQKRKDGETYIMHPLRVMFEMKGRSEYMLAAAVMHDVVEDSEWTVDDLRRLFDDGIAEIVDALSHREDETYKDYIKRLVKDPYAVIIKRADVGDNLRKPEWISDSLVERYCWTLRELDKAEEDESS